MYTINYYYCKRPYYEIKQKIINNLGMVVQFKTFKVTNKDHNPLLERYIRFNNY